MNRFMALALFGAVAFAQIVPMPSPEVQYLDAAGAPLAGGKLCTYVANTMTPASTYSDSIGTLNTNPVFLDSAGRASLWGNSGQLYKLVLLSPGSDNTCFTGVLQWTQDNVPLNASAGGVSGSIQFNNGGQITGSANLTWNNLTNLLTVTTASTGTPGIAVANGYIQSGGGFLSTANSWQGFNTATDGALLRGLSIGQNVSGTLGGYAVFSPITYNPNGGGPCTDIYGNPVNQPIPLNGLSAFGAHDVVMWNSLSPSMPPTGCGPTIPVDTLYGLNINTYFFARGGLATDIFAYNAVHALEGGMAAKLGYTMDQALYGANHPTTGDLNTPAAGYGAFAHKGGSVWWYWNDATTSWNQVDLSVTGGGGGTPGGSSTQVQYNASGTFAGSANMTWDNANRLFTVTALDAAHAGIVVGTGFIQSDTGFLATTGSAVNYNAFQAAGGGFAGKSFTATGYIQTGHSTGAPTLTTGDAFHPGAMYWDDGSAAEQVWNGSSWISLGGGSGTPGGATTNVQYNSAGSFAGSANFTWNNSTKLLTVTASGSGAAGIAVATGFMQADTGFLATSGIANNWNAIYAPTGGVAGRSFTATTYVQTGTTAGTPTVTSGDTFHPGAMNWNSTSGCEQVFNGSTWVCLGTGAAGVSSLNGATGALLIQGTANRVIVSTLSPTITLSTPQDIATSSSVLFATVTASGTVQSTATGASTTFQNSNFNFQVNGNGAVSAAGVIQSTGASGGVNVTAQSAFNSIQTVGGVNVGSSGGSNGVYAVANTTVIDSFRRFVGAGVDVGANGINAGNYNVNGGFIGQTWTVSIPGMSIGGTGCTGGLIFRGGILISCF